MNNRISRRDLIIAGGSAFGAIGIPSLSLGNALSQVRGAALTSEKILLSGKVLEYFGASATPPISRLMFSSDRATGYTSFYLQGFESELLRIATSAEPYARLQGRFRNDSSLLLTFDLDQEPEQGSRQPLPDYNGPVDMTIEEQGTAETMLEAYSRASFGGSDSYSALSVQDVAAHAFAKFRRDSSEEYRYDLIPFAAFQTESQTEGVSLYRLVEESKDRNADCLEEILTAIIMFLVGQVLVRTSPTTVRAVRTEARAILNNPGVRQAMQNILTAAKNIAKTNGDIGVLVATIIRNLSNIGRDLAGGVLRAIRASVSWWEYTIAAAACLATCVKAVKAAVTVVSLAHTLYKIGKACT